MTDQRMRLIAYVTIAGEAVQVDDVGTNTFEHHYVHAPNNVRFIVAEAAQELDDRHAHAYRFLSIDTWEAWETTWNGISPAEYSPSFPDPAAAIMSAVLKVLDNG